MHRRRPECPGIRPRYRFHLPLRHGRDQRCAPALHSPPRPWRCVLFLLRAAPELSLFVACGLRLALSSGWTWRRRERCFRLGTLVNFQSLFSVPSGRFRGMNPNRQILPRRWRLLNPEHQNRTRRQCCRRQQNCPGPSALGPQPWQTQPGPTRRVRHLRLCRIGRHPGRPRLCFYRRLGQEHHIPTTRTPAQMFCDARTFRPRQYLLGKGAQAVGVGMKPGLFPAIHRSACSLNAPAPELCNSSFQRV